MQGVQSTHCHPQRNRGKNGTTNKGGHSEACATQQAHCQMALLCLRHSRRALTEAAPIKHVGYQAVWYRHQLSCG